MEIGDKIKVHKKYVDIFKDYNDRYRSFFDAMEHFASVAGITRDKLYDTVYKVYPELEGLHFMINNKGNEIIILREREEKKDDK